MNLNLKNRPNVGDAIAMKKWFEGFEKELRELEKNGRLCGTLVIKEILGE